MIIKFNYLSPQPECNADILSFLFTQISQYVEHLLNELIVFKVELKAFLLVLWILPA